MKQWIITKPVSTVIKVTNEQASIEQQDGFAALRVGLLRDAEFISETERAELDKYWTHIGLPHFFMFEEESTGPAAPVYQLEFVFDNGSHQIDDKQLKAKTLKTNLLGETLRAC